jgi:hypothetical protein
MQAQLRCLAVRRTDLQFYHQRAVQDLETLRNAAIAIESGGVLWLRVAQQYALPSAAVRA